MPHSHPVLTLSAGAATDDEVLATFIHEQFHWLEDDRPGFTAAILGGHGFYTWLYDRVLSDPLARRITKEHGMTIEAVALR